MCGVVAGKQEMFVVQLIVHFHHTLLLGEIVGLRVMDQAAGILRRWQLLSKVESLLVDLRDRNLIVGERSLQGNDPLPVAIWRCKVGEVPLQHLRRGNERHTGKRVGALDSGLVAREEKELVLLNRSAERATKLIAFQLIAKRR